MKHSGPESVGNSVAGSSSGSKLLDFKLGIGV